MPMPQMQTVQSSMIWQLGYDAEGKALYVRFTPSKKHPAGRLAVMPGVMPQDADDLINAPSIGQAWHLSFKSRPLTYL